MSEDRFKALGTGTPDESVAKAIEGMTTKERVKMLSVIGGGQVPQFALMYNVGSELKYRWLEKYADDYLMLTCSVKGRRANDIVEIIKASIERATGSVGKVADFIRGKG